MSRTPLQQATEAQTKLGENGFFDDPKDWQFIRRAVLVSKLMQARTGEPIATYRPRPGGNPEVDNYLQALGFRPEK